MIAPFFDTPSGILAIPIGIAFGATLERAGLGSARTIADQLRGRDFTVIKVMFSAIVTAMIGIFWANWLGWLDLSRVGIPVTDVVPQLIGAVLFGAGFAIASLCPGTACVSAATGKRDGVAAIVGLLAGTLVVSLAWTRLGSLAELAPRPDATLPADLGLPVGVVVAAITCIALLAITLSDRLVVSSRADTRFRMTPLGTLAVVVGVLAVVAGTGQAADAGGITPLDLAARIRDRQPHLRIIDVRDSVAADDYRIPGAELVRARDLPQLSALPGDTIVLYGDGGADTRDAAASLRRRGVRDVFALRDGIVGWESDVMAPRAPDPADSAAVARFQSVRELSAWFGGKPSREAAPATAAPRPRRKNSC